MKPPTRWRPKVETLRTVSELAANGMMTAAALVACVFLINRLLAEPAVQQAPPAVYDQSERLPDGLPPSVFEAKRIALVHVRSTCGFCTESMPFYRALAAQRASGNKVVVVGAEPEPVLAAYLQKQGFRPDQVVQIDRAYFRNDTTPLIVVTDSARTVVGSWLGMLDDKREQEVLRLLGG